jgi:hypothetical protein
MPITSLDAYGNHEDGCSGFVEKVTERVVDDIIAEKKGLS